MNDEDFRKIAKDYLNTYAQTLHREQAELEQTSPPATPLLDRRIHSRIAAVKRKRVIKIGSLLAACLVIAVSIPVFLQTVDTPLSPESTSSAGAVPAAPAASTTPSEGTASSGYQVLPLTFSLPAQFSVADVKQDQGKTIYYFDDQNADPVVMTMEVTTDRSAFQQLTPLVLPGSGREAYGHSGQGYQMLCFEEQGILYTLTCAHDINTLVSLSRNI